LNVRAGARRHHQRCRARFGRDVRIRACFHESLDHVEVVDLGREQDRRGNGMHDLGHGESGTLAVEGIGAALHFFGGLFLVLLDAQVRVRAVLQKRLHD
jgi:hypothetical protein